MNVAVGPTTGLRGGDDVRDHAGGAADVHVGAQRLRRQQRLGGGGLSLAVVIHVNSVAFSLPQALQECGVFGRADGIVQLVGHAAAVQVLELRKEGGDADASGDQYMFAGDLVEAEQIHRMRDFK